MTLEEFKHKVDLESKVYRVDYDEDHRPYMTTGTVIGFQIQGGNFLMTANPNEMQHYKVWAISEEEAVSEALAKCQSEIDQAHDRQAALLKLQTEVVAGIKIGETVVRCICRTDKNGQPEMIYRNYEVRLYSADNKTVGMRDKSGNYIETTEEEFLAYYGKTAKEAESKELRRLQAVADEAITLKKFLEEYI